MAPSERKNSFIPRKVSRASRRRRKMTDAELWTAVGKHLAHERRRRGWTLRDVMRRGGPNYATVQANERGQIRTMAALTDHLAVLGWRVFDLCLLIAGQHPIAVAADGAAVVAARAHAPADGRPPRARGAASFPRRPPPSPPTTGPAPGAGRSSSRGTSRPPPVTRTATSCPQQAARYGRPCQHA